MYNTDGRFVGISPVPTKQKNSVSLHFTLQKGIQTSVRNHCETKSKQNFFTGPEKGNIFWNNLMQQQRIINFVMDQYKQKVNNILL
jgi:hypothetical protein